MIKMKKTKFDWKGLCAILMVAFGSIMIIHDFIKLLNGYCYTILGLGTMFVILILTSEAIEYIQSKLKGE